MEGAGLSAIILLTTNNKAAKAVIALAALIAAYVFAQYAISN